tara:strand:- start:1080 stop:1346 length:267 start_codon:yes stop_codon:yes gene_type:complete
MIFLGGIKETGLRITQVLIVGAGPVGLTLAIDLGQQGALLHKCVRDPLVGSSAVAGGHEQLVPYEVQDQELAFVQYSAEAARFAIDLV